MLTVQEKYGLVFVTQNTIVKKTIYLERWKLKISKTKTEYMVQLFKKTKWRGKERIVYRVDGMVQMIERDIP